MRKQRTSKHRPSNRIAAAALREAARIGSIAGTMNPENTGEMKNVLSTLLAAEETVQDLARRYIRQRTS